MKKLREIRERAGLTGSELAYRVGVTKGYIYNVEVGRESSPSPRFIRDASLILGLALGIDAAEVQAEVFGERLTPSPEAPPSFLERRVGLAQEVA